MKSNLYKPCQPGLTKAISTSLLKASYNVLLNLDSELNLKDNEIGDKCKRIFNNLKSDLPVIYDAKITEDEHHFHYLNPIIRPIFNDTHENYKLHLNKSVDGSLERPDFSCQKLIELIGQKLSDEFTEAYVEKISTMIESFILFTQYEFFLYRVL
ncbi:7300_t:CDS:2 [Entrophospora sp. SA101]|nr:19389_t:CDS:2 [Entrophospora sp. SA101]CAJ0926035.1 7300_t:CDS:2 [Entrophospora sp. SA101]